HQLRSCAPGLERHGARHEALGDLPLRDPAAGADADPAADHRVILFLDPGDVARFARRRHRILPYWPNHRRAHDHAGGTKSRLPRLRLRAGRLFRHLLVPVAALAAVRAAAGGTRHSRRRSEPQPARKRLIMKELEARRASVAGALSELDAAFRELA